MNRYASTKNFKSKIPLVFNLSMQLVSIRFRSPKSISMSLEFSIAKTVVSSKNFHRLEANAYETVLKETIDLPIVAIYDSRKARFMPQTIDVGILSNHAGFNKKLANGSINISQMLNSKALVSREQIKLDKCVDKSAILNVKIILDFKGTQSVNEVDSIDQSKFSLSTIR